MQEYLNKYLERFTNKEIEEIKSQSLLFKSKRAEIVDEIYKIYVAHNKKSNIHRFLKIYKKNTEENQKLFIKSKEYYKPLPISSFCYRISHIPTDDLYYVLSIARDKDKRKENFASWIMWATKA